jgi:hypothetical protein
MKRIHAFWSLCLVLILSACAPLQPHGSAWGDAGEVALRVLACPLTLCMSEAIVWQNAEQQQRQAAHARWYRSLSREEQDREDRREAAALQALGLALSGGGPFQARPRIAPVVPPCQSLIGNQIGTTTYLTCY